MSDLHSGRLGIWTQQTGTGSTPAYAISAGNWAVAQNNIQLLMDMIAAEGSDETPANRGFIDGMSPASRIFIWRSLERLKSLTTPA